MHRRMIRRAAAAALMLLVAATTTTFAESIAADADGITVGDQSTIDLGTVAPGQDVPVDVSFRLDCTGTDHVDAAQSVRLSPGTRTIPPGGSFSVGSVTLTPGAGWPADGVACPTGLPAITGVRHMIVTAPPDPATDLRYVFSWTRSLVPSTAGDASVLSGANPTVTFVLDVSTNTPPTLTLPTDATVEGNASGGALAAYTVSATDIEDATAPVPVCSPALGALLPLGTTTIACSATDSGGLTTTGSFHITVVDTTAPTLIGMPADPSMTTNDPGGATLTYPMPTATDIVDPTATVACIPASGSAFPIGTTPVTCTATDATGNHASASFAVHVTLAPTTDPGGPGGPGDSGDPTDLVAWSARWRAPIAAGGGAFVAHLGRTIPVKVRIYADGVEQKTGDARLDVSSCDGTAVLELRLTRHDGRWATHLDTRRLGGPGCYIATVSLDGHVAGSVRFDVVGTTHRAGPRDDRSSGRHDHDRPHHEGAHPR